VAIALPGFLLRSLIPVGFMPMFGPGLHLSLMLCETYAPVPAIPAPAASMAMPMDMPMDMAMPMAAGVPHPDHPDHPDHQEHNSACPYGSGPTLATTAVWAAPQLASLRSAQPRDSTPQVTTFAVLPRAQSPRGPPSKA
jgi:hypothetical protein